MEVSVSEQVLQRGVTVIIVSREVTAASRETDETSHYFVKLKNLFFSLPRAGKEGEDEAARRGRIVGLYKVL